jgi:hypothetical protein
MRRPAKVSSPEAALISQISRSNILGRWVVGSLEGRPSSGPEVLDGRLPRLCVWQGSRNGRI